MEAGKIEILLEGVSFEETKRLREVIHTLLANGSFNVKNGRVIMHYDNDSNLMKVDHEFVKYYRKKS